MRVHTFQLYLRLLGVQIRSQMQYRVSFLFLLFGTGLTALVEFLSLALAMLRFETIGGWTIPEVAFLYGMVEFSFGTMDLIFSGFDPQEFGQKVRLGAFDQVLLRPVNVTVQVLSSRFLLRRIGKMLVGVGIFAFALYALDIAWNPLKLAYLLVVIASMVMFFGGLFIIGATVTFWTVESIEVINILTYGGSYVISHPMHIFQGWLRRFFTFIVPAIFLNYYPALYFLDKPAPFPIPAYASFLSPLVGVGVLALSTFVWRFGIRHYQSTGT